MNIILSPEEVQQAISFYLGSEYSVNSIAGARRRSEGSKEFDEFVLEIGCTRAFEDFTPTKAPVPSFKVSASVNTDEPTTDEEIPEPEVESVTTEDTPPFDVEESEPVEVETPTAPRSLFGNS